MLTLRKFFFLQCWNGWPGSRGRVEGWEGTCVGSGICGNLMCWQLRGKRQESGGELELGFDQDCPCPLSCSCGASISLCLSASLRFQLCLGALGERGRRGGVFHLLSLWNCHLIGAPGPLSPPSFSVFPLSPRLSSFPLPADMADLLSHAPCRWAGGQVPAEL